MYPQLTEIAPAIRRDRHSYIHGGKQTSLLTKQAQKKPPFPESRFPFTDSEEEPHIIGPTSSLDIRLIVGYLSVIAPGIFAPL